MLTKRLLSRSSKQPALGSVSVGHIGLRLASALEVTRVPGCWPLTARPASFRHKEAYTWTNPTCCVHNVIIGKLWIEQYGTVEILNHW